MNKGFNSDLPETGIEVRAKKKPFLAIPEEQQTNAQNQAAHDNTGTQANVLEDALSPREIKSKMM